MGKYFSISELSNSSTAKANNINNIPNGEVLHNLDRLISDLLDPVRERWGCPIRVTSGYRCTKLNRLVGGSSTSQHITGKAADITVGSPEKNRQLFEMILNSGLLFDQIIFEDGGKWVHVSYDWRDIKANRKQALEGKRNKKTNKMYYIKYQ